jgi:Uma2 family endonuclease
MESERHYTQKNLLGDTLKRAWSDRSVYVGNEMAIYFSELQARNNDFRAPDLFVVLDTTRRERKSWVVWQEGGRMPDVVIELLSESTAAIDRGEKKRIYNRILRVRNYFLFDPETGQLEGFHLPTDGGDYVPLTPSANGDLPCPVLGLSLGLRQGSYLGVEAQWLRWIGPDGAVLPSAEEEARRFEEAAQRSEEAAQRSEEAAQRSEEAAQRSEEQARITREQLARALEEIERLKAEAGRKA